MKEIAKETIAYIVPDEHTKELVRKSMASIEKNVDIVIETLAHSNIYEQAQEIVDAGANVIILRGGSHHYLKPLLNVPVVNMKINVSNILQALMKAKNMSSNIALLLEENIYFNPSTWKPLIGDNVVLYRFKHYSEIKDVVAQVHEDQPSAVVIGGIITTDTARKLKHDTVLIETMEDTILESYYQAIDILDNIREHSKKLNTLLSVIHNIEDGVLILNNTLHVEYYNEKLTDIKSKTHIKVGDYLNQVFPEILELVNEHASDGCQNSIMQIGSRTISVNIVPLMVKKIRMGIVITLKDIGELQKLERKIRYQLSKKGLVAKYKFEDIMTWNKQMTLIIEKAKRIAQSDSTVLIYGESGTGKEMFAQSIHNYSNRRNGPFVAINCAALSDTLLESELFGYVDGAFTGARKEGKQGLFELAHKGTIFLDEINSISKQLQSKLLRVIEEKEVMRLGSDSIIPLDIRILSATNEDLPGEVEKGDFRSDLFYRLNVLETRLLPLRERKEDILKLFERFVERMTKEACSLDEKLETLLMRHEWQGNIRELMNVAERYVIQGSEQSYASLFYENMNQPSMSTKIAEGQLDLKELSSRIEKSVIEALEANEFSKNEIADILGISRTALWKKRKQYE